MSRGFGFATIVLHVLAYVLRYLAAGFLTAAVLTTLTLLIVLYVAVWGPEMEFLSILSPFLPIDAQGNARISGDDIMRAFSIMSLIMMGVAAALKAMIRKLGLHSENRDDNQTRGRFMHGLGIPLIFITIVYAGSTLAMLLTGAARGPSEGGILSIMALTYGIAMVSSLIYKAIDAFSQGILGRIRSVSDAGPIGSEP